MRPLVEGVVSHEEDVDPQIGQGRLDDQTGYVLEVPKEVVARVGGMEALQNRGKARYGIYCAPCHGAAGGGQGMVTVHAQKSGAAAFAPPTFHQDRLRHAPDGQIFATITNGKNNMPPYAMQIPVNDRWAIVSYVRVLQLVQPKLAEEKAPDQKGTPSEGKPL
jgi:mono/diheme cytochrome c family protein